MLIVERRFQPRQNHPERSVYTQEWIILTSSLSSTNRFRVYYFASPAPRRPSTVTRWTLHADPPFIPGLPRCCRKEGCSARERRKSHGASSIHSPFGRIVLFVLRPNKGSQFCSGLCDGWLVCVVTKHLFRNRIPASYTVYGKLCFFDS